MKKKHRLRGSVPNGSKHYGGSEDGRLRNVPPGGPLGLSRRLGSRFSAFIGVSH